MSNFLKQSKIKLQNANKNTNTINNSPGLGATKSNFTLAFCCSVNLLMESKELFFGSPITNHQPSSRFYNKI